jgi:hypothetical protein
MALFGAGKAKAKEKDEDVTALIAKKNYARAIEVIRQQLQSRKNDPRVRLQLGDVLILAGKGPQAIPILMGLADEYARDGFAAKAISVLKKIQKIDQGRYEVETRLAALIQEKQSQATVTAAPARGFDIGIEEIGADAGLEIGMDGIASPISTPTPAAPAATAGPEPELEIQAEPLEEEAASPLAPLEAAPAPIASAPGPEPAFVPEVQLEPEPQLVLEEEPLDISLEPEPEPLPEDALVVEPEPEVAASASPVVDRDFLEEEGAEVEPEPAGPMSDGAFADELMSLVDEAFKDFPTAEDGSLALPQAEAPAGGSQIVVSPLFRNFSVDEMVAVIQGLKLLSFERGDVILREGQPGNSLYMLTAGKVRAFVKRAGKQAKLGDLEEGAFFGEVSILTGQPRTATIAALTYCELLELDRPTLDSIAERHPHVMDVLKEFAQQRLQARG